MKKAGVILLVLFFSLSLRAAPVYRIAGPFPGFFSVDAVYSEKYFEYSALYEDFFLPVSNEWKERSEPLRGIIYEAGARLGLPKGYAAGFYFTYITQKSGDEDRNDLHAVYVAGHKKIEGLMNVTAGIRIPGVWGSFGEGLLNRGGYYGIFAGVEAEGQVGQFLLGAEMSCETGLISGAPGRFGAAGFLGYRIFSDDRHFVDLKIETEYNFDSNEGGSAYVIPKAVIRFDNGFMFSIGAEGLFYARDALLNRYDRLLYRAGVSYSVYSSGRDEEKTDEIKEGATWREQGIDTEMIPESWLEEKLK